MDGQGNNPVQAAISMLAAMLIIGLIDNFIAVIADTISLWQFQIVRAAMAVPLIGLAAWLGFGSLRPRRLWAVAVRSLLISTAMVFYFGALAFMPIAQALAGLFTSPIFVLLVTAFGLRQKVGPVRILAVALGFAGILLVLGPQATALGPLAFVPVLGGLFYALGAVATRALCAQEQTLTLLIAVMITQAVIGALALAVLTVADPVVPEGADGFVLRGWVGDMGAALPWVALQAVGSVLGVGLIIRAYLLGEASYVAVFEYSVMIFGPVFGFLLTGQTVAGWQIVGIALIAGAGGLIAWRTH